MFVRIIHSHMLLLLAIAFVLFTIIGTLSHEAGHWLAARTLGYKAELHYGSTSYQLPDSINNADEPLNYHTLLVLKHHSMFITGAGPVQTMLTGIAGLIILYIRRRSVGLKAIDWLAVFFALFWLREAFNLFMSVSQKLLHNSSSYFGGDEAYLSELLELPIGFIPILLGVVGFIFAFIIVFKVIPKALRPTFIVSGLIGGCAGYGLWFHLLGPVLMP